MAGSWRPDDNYGRSRRAHPPRGRADRARDHVSGRARDQMRPTRSGQRGTRAADSRVGGSSGGLTGAWRRFRARPNSPQIIAGTLLALALVCAALGVLIHPSTALGSYVLPQTSSGGRVGTAAISGTPDGTAGSILAPTATPPSAPTATSTAAH